MNPEFKSKLLDDFVKSPSPSEADNDLFINIVTSGNQTGHKGTTQLDIHVRSLLAWQTKKLPRHLVTEDGRCVPDHLSGPKWSPAFYRIDGCLPHLITRLQGADVLDPFAGSGSLMHSLLAFDIPNSVALNDVCYRGGLPLWRDDVGRPFYYCPEKNLEEYRLLFNKFSDHIKEPSMDGVVSYTADKVEHGLAFGTKAFDWIFTDPPYGRTIGERGCEDLFDYLPEMRRVTRHGVLAIIPEDWIPKIEATGKYGVENLSGTLAHKNTTFRTALTHIY